MEMPREGEVENKVFNQFFSRFAFKKLGDIDFCIVKPLDRYEGQQKELFSLDSPPPPIQSYLWAEAKRSKKSDLYESIVQLILTIGKAKTFEHHLPPIFLGAFDTEKIAFIPYNKVNFVFTLNDFNWKVTPSDHKSNAFKRMYSLVKDALESSVTIFHFQTDKKDLKEYIKSNFVLGKQGEQLIVITKNNFTTVYFKWLRDVKPSIGVDWELLKQNNVIDADFYLADLLSDKDMSLRESLSVLLKREHYEFGKIKNALGLDTVTKVDFKDSQKAHHQFWNIYKRPPRKDYWDYIVKRRDLLVPQDIRERKGSFFTPQIWVEKSQEYIAKVLGEDWQDEYYVWDCCAGTGNLLNGLTNKYRIWASTIDKADVDVMMDRIENGANLVRSHVFQFDFLNDSFDDPKLPDSLRKVLNDPEKRKKLVIYINPPYAEVSSVGKKGKAGVNISATQKTYSAELGTASRELFAQFLMRIYFEVGGCLIANFSKLKGIQGSEFSEFRRHFQPKLEKMFVVPANTFDNVKGLFPIGFFIWDSGKKESFEKVKTAIYNEKGEYLGEKTICRVDRQHVINKWISLFKSKDAFQVGFLCGTNGNDFQQNKIVYIINHKSQMANPRGIWITPSNVIPSCVYNAIRHVIATTWLNDRDQFLVPNSSWEKDVEFYTNCFTYTLFTNNIRANAGINHWIPFTEDEVNAVDCFDSHFMTDFISGKYGQKTLKQAKNNLLSTGNTSFIPMKPIKFSVEAITVFEVGRKLWAYYHQQHDVNPNASLYDIKAYFQGTNEKGKMNAKSSDERYNELILGLRSALEALAEKIRPKVYEHGFLVK